MICPLTWPLTKTIVECDYTYDNWYALSASCSYVSWLDCLLVLHRSSSKYWHLSVWLCSLKHRWEDLCKFRFFPYRNQYSFQLYELDDDYIQQEIQKPPKQTSCTVSFSCLAVLILILIFFCMCAYWNFEHMTVTVTPVHISIMKLCNTCFSVILLKGSSISNINPIVILVHCIVWMSYISQFWTLHLNTYGLLLYLITMLDQVNNMEKHKEIELSYSIFLGTSLSEKWRK